MSCCDTQKCCSNGNIETIKTFKIYKTIYLNIRTIMYLFFSRGKERALIDRTVKSFVFCIAELHTGHRPDKDWNIRIDKNDTIT